LYANTRVKVTRFALTDVTASLKPTSGTGSASTDANLAITGGNGAFVIKASGIAGNFSGTISGGTSLFSANISVSVRINTTGAAVDETIAVGGTSIDVKFTTAAETANPYIQVSGSGVV